MKQQLLLLEDVDGLGRGGDIVVAKPGFVRNFLLPRKKAMIAGKHTLKMQALLREEREKRATKDRLEGEELVAKLRDFELKTEVKVDSEGRMYGSVTTLDIVHLLKEHGYSVEKKNISLPHSLKKIGLHKINLKLKEGVTGSFQLDISPEGGKIEAPEQEQSKTEVEKDGEKESD